MAEFLCKTRGEHGAEHKARVYFTCHPVDFERSFEKLTEDVLSAQSCAVYYTADMTATEEEMYTDAVLGRMNLFVIPVSHRLLTEPCRALLRDLAYAKQEGIPILPVMLEEGIDRLYSRPDAFGERQYLSPYKSDATGVAYEEKLRRYLSSVLVGEKLAARVRAAFDAYIFLSYRKRDRAYADALMRLIHKNPECRDIAIWYDEFLTPGESFRENIFRVLERSDLFALLVTPSLLEENNFVMTEEYPAARAAGKLILPMEMQKTDREALRAGFSDLPEPADPLADGAFRERLLASLSRLAVTENDGDPEHNFLIGLAYLEGIDVETDRARALTLITMAAEAGLREAMEKLYEMYFEGTGTKQNYKEAHAWAERIVALYREMYGEEHPSTLAAYNNLAIVKGRLGDFRGALALQERVYEARLRVSGEMHADTLTALSNLAFTHSNLGAYSRALALEEELYEKRVATFGEAHPDTLTALNNLAITCARSGDYARALRLQERVATLRTRVLGEEHPDTVSALHNLAHAYAKVGNYARALAMQEEVYARRMASLGEEDYRTLSAMHNLASTLDRNGEYERARKLKERVYELRARILGEEHPDTLVAESNLAVTLGRLGEHARAKEIEERVYAIYCRTLGAEHPSALITLNNLALSCSALGEHDRALDLKKQVYETRLRLSGAEHPDTLTAKNNLAVSYSDVGNLLASLALHEETYEARVRVLGEDHPSTLMSLNNLAVTCEELRESDRAVAYAETLCERRHRTLGAAHPKTQEAERLLSQLRARRDRKK